LDETGVGEGVKEGEGLIDGSGGTVELFNLLLIGVVLLFTN